MEGLAKRLTVLVPKRVSSIIDATLGFCLLVFGLYIDSPFYQSSPTTIIGAAFEADLARFVISLFYIVPPIMVFVGYMFNKDRIRSLGMFSVFLAYLFNTILRVATFGVQPVSWIFTLALCVIAAAMFINFKLKLEID